MTTSKATTKTTKAVDKPAPKKAAKNIKPVVVYPDGWNIEQEKDVPVLVFYKSDSPIMKIEITPETMGEMLEELNETLILKTNSADSWTIRSPEDESLPDFLTLINSGKVLGTLEIDKATGFKMWMYLSKYKPQVNPRKSLAKWSKKHRVLSGLFIVIAVPMVLYTAYRIFLNITGLG
jgi:hypothetical protein